VELCTILKDAYNGDHQPGSGKEEAVFRRGADKSDVLKSVPLFSELSKKHLDLIGKRLDEVDMAAGTVLAREGELGEEFVFLLEGRVRVEKGGKPINTLSSGDFFGEISLLDRGPRTATIVADSDVALLVLHVRYFDELLEKIPDLSRQMLRALCGYLRRTEAQGG
jgi:CRP-like cAMP-binding protein